MSLESWPTPLVLLLLTVAGLVTWFGGVRLSESTEFLSRRFEFGQTFAGLAIVAVITNLPECAIATFAALKGQTDLLVGNVLGGIATQAMVIVILDWSTVRDSVVARGSHPTLILQSLFLVAILALAIVGARPPFPVGEAPIFEAVLFLGWIFALAVMYFQRAGGGDDVAGEHHLDRPFLVFGCAALATFMAGLGLSLAVEEIGDRFHLNGVVMGATVLASVTALPEISSALAAVRIKAYRMALGDVIGGNLFMPGLLFPVALVLRRGILKRAASEDIYFTGLAILVVLVFTYGMWREPKQKKGRLSKSSWTAIVVFALGILGASLAID